MPPRHCWDGGLRSALRQVIPSRWPVSCFGTFGGNLTILGGNALPDASNGTVILPNDSNAYIGNTIISHGHFANYCRWRFGRFAVQHASRSTMVYWTSIRRPNITSAHGFDVRQRQQHGRDRWLQTFTTIAAVSGSGTLTKTGVGTLGSGRRRHLWHQPSCRKVILQALNPNALGTGTITMNGGQLPMLDNTAAQGTIALSQSSYNQDVFGAECGLIDGSPSGGYVRPAWTVPTAMSCIKPARSSRLRRARVCRQAV